MPMTREEHEAFLNELLAPEIDHTRRTEILQQLRVDYTSVTSDFEELTSTQTKLQAENTDLVLSNSKLFRQMGTQDDPKQKEVEQEKDFSQTVSLESLEKGVN